MVGILGKKIGMTQVFGDQAQILPVTVIESGPCCVLQIKTKESDGYNAVQLGFGEIKDSKLSKPVREKFKKIKASPRRFIKEILVENPQDYQVAQDIDVTQFNPGDFVDIVSISKGRGFQGGIKRWNWSGGPKSHGSMSHRSPGSIGASAYPSRVVKGHHLPGHMGNQRVTVQNLKVVKIDKDNNLLIVKGSVPGHNNCYLIINKSKKKKSK
ncbi:MAG: 50S ribosomal protein L3 [Candidatus Omnitrophica bacterium]|nr:50S ribosomal protein L3 [Candidatus Omnitrophota bacterium]